MAYTQVASPQPVPAFNSLFWSLFNQPGSERNMAQQRSCAGGKSMPWMIKAQPKRDAYQKDSSLEEGCSSFSQPPTGLQAWLCCGWRLTFATLLLLALIMFKPVVMTALKNGFRSLYYGWDCKMFGRNDAMFPAPRCCAGAECAVPRTSRVMALSYLRSAQYLPLLQQLECSFRKSNPGVELGVMTVAGELPPAARQWMERRNITLIDVEPLSYSNFFAPRYSQNWLKLRALGLTDYDAILLLDSDVVVVGDISPLFSLPTDFAASWDQTKWLGRFNTWLKPSINGGVMLLRPCPAAQQHMIELLERYPKLRFTYGAAEQDFFGWYYKYTGMMLPVEYNTMASDSLHGDLTVGGRPPVILHFTQNKPFRGAVPGQPGHQFLCSRAEILAGS